jgi:PAS domain S-box-containing protein
MSKSHKVPIFNVSSGPLQQFVDHVPASLAMFDCEMRYLAVSKRWRENYKLGDRSIIGCSHYEVFPEIQERWKSVHRRCLAGEVITAEQDRFVRSDGTVQWLRWEVRPWYTDGGGVGGITIFSEDITERKFAEEVLQNKEASLRAIMDNLPYLTWMKDSEGYYISINKTFADYLKLGDIQEAVGKTDQDLHPKELAEKYRADDIEVMQSRRQKHVEEFGFDGQKRHWVETFKTPIIDGQGKVLGTVGCARDITDRVEQEELRLSEVREQRDLLVREVHHRIKNHLQGVVGLLQSHADLYPELADVIEAAVGRIYSIAIIHGLQSNVQREEIDLGTLLKSMVDQFGSNLELVNELLHPVLLSQTVAVSIALVLNELMTNANKHSVERSLVSVTIKVIGADAHISVNNYFDNNRLNASKGGYGLKLVKSLLPRKAVTLDVLLDEDIYRVELKLSPPAIIIEPNKP